MQLEYLDLGWYIFLRLSVKVIITLSLIVLQGLRFPPRPLCLCLPWWHLPWYCSFWLTSWMFIPACFSKLMSGWCLVFTELINTESYVRVVRFTGTLPNSRFRLDLMPERNSTLISPNSIPRRIELWWKFQYSCFPYESKAYVS